MDAESLVGLGDHPALDFLNSTAMPGHETIELIGDGRVTCAGWSWRAHVPASTSLSAPGAPDRQAACVLVSHPEQGWSLLCNGVVVFEDTGALLPDGRSIPPRRLAHPQVTARLHRPPRPMTACAARAVS